MTDETFKCSLCGRTYPIEDKAKNEDKLCKWCAGEGEKQEYPNRLKSL